jgi:hypothetical protein
MRFFVFILACFILIAPSAFADMTDQPVAQLQMLDKSTARTSTIEARIDQTLQFGSLYIKPRACRTSGPFDRPENAAFLQTWEVPIGKTEPEWVFSGWMFSSSPALSAMDHPVYDVWVLNCFDPDAPVVEAPETVTIVDGEEIDLEENEAEDVPQAENQENGEVAKPETNEGGVPNLMTGGMTEEVAPPSETFDRMMEGILGEN